MNHAPFPSFRILLAGIIGISGAAFTSAAGEWQSLFDGKTMSGWEANENPGTWVIQDGMLITKGPRSHLFYVGPVGGHNFKNFEFSAEVLTLPNSNSGIYIHTHFKPDPWPAAGYECQVINSHSPTDGSYAERKMTGSIYAVRNTWRAPARDNEWFEYRIKVSGKTIQTFVNGELVCQYTEPPQSWRAKDKPGRYLSSGTFALQGHDPKSEVYYRNLKVRLLPDDSPSLEEPLADNELDTLITQFSDANVALIDLGITPSSPGVAQAQGDVARTYGMTLGYMFAEQDVDLAQIGASGPVVLINDKDSAPSVALMKSAKANGAKLAFSSGGVTRLDPERLRKRLVAMRDAGLEWRDLWIPGK
ncbi:MAG: DUF1080 domain-containing protein [Opitutus sp.]